MQAFVESCVEFEVAHLSIPMVRRLSYVHEIPTLTVSGFDSLMYHTTRVN